MVDEIMTNNYNNKRFYWIKLRETFMTSDAVDFLMGQKDGANYVVLYQMLCLKTINTGGELSRTIGEVIIPYDIDKIVRDMKWFTKDTVIVALELYKKLNLIFQNNNGNLALTDFDKMIGSETQSAIYKQERKQLENFQQDSNRYIDIKILDNNIIDYNINSSSSNINNSVSVFDFLENNFGRTIAPVEFETIEYWVKELNSDIVKEAIKIATNSNKKTINYVEGILKNWRSKGYKTLEEVKQENKINEEPLGENIQEILDYDWLNDK